VNSVQHHTRSNHSATCTASQLELPHDRLASSMPNTSHCLLAVVKRNDAGRGQSLSSALVPPRAPKTPWLSGLLILGHASSFNQYGNSGIHTHALPFEYVNVLDNAGPRHKLLSLRPTAPNCKTPASGLTQQKILDEHTHWSSWEKPCLCVASRDAQQPTQSTSHGKRHSRQLKAFP
jgi:hypothetical protein